MGVKPEEIPQWMRDLQNVPREERGPGGHVLTGPIYVTGADSGDVLEVRILQIDLATDYGYNGQRPYSGLLTEDFTQLSLGLGRDGKADSRIFFEDSLGLRGDDGFELRAEECLDRAVKLHRLRGAHVQHPDADDVKTGAGEEIDDVAGAARGETEVVRLDEDERALDGRTGRMAALVWRA